MIINESIEQGLRPLDCAQCSLAQNGGRCDGVYKAIVDAVVQSPSGFEVARYGLSNAVAAKIALQSMAVSEVARAEELNACAQLIRGQVATLESIA